MSRKANIVKLVLIAQFLFTLLACICTALSVKTGPEIAAALIGLLMVQILLAAVWSAMGEVRIIFRVAASTGIVLFLIGCFYRMVYRDGAGHDIALTLSMPLTIQFVLLQIPLWFARGFGWRIRIQQPGTENAETRSEFQFGILQLLCWTTVVAVSIAIVRAFVDNVDLSAGRKATGAIEWDITIFMTVVNSLIALPVIWGAFVHRRAWIWFVIAMFMCALACSAKWATTTNFDGRVEFLLIVTISQTILSMIVMLAVRQLGLRLQRVVKSQKKTQTLGV